MMHIRNLIVWMASTVSAILLADAAISVYKVLEFRAAFPAPSVLNEVLFIYGAVLAGSALNVYAGLSDLSGRSRTALGCSTGVCIIGLAANLVSLPEMTKEALDNKNVSLAICLLCALVLQIPDVRRPPRT
jgi:hypothetical protein